MPFLSLFSKVKYVRTDQKDNYIYEIYKAKSEKDATKFLQKKKVNKELYYLIVEYPGGSLGRDIDGIYEES